jgi:Ca2+/H+ antiporter
LTSVLLDFVHISPGAWISVMATANLIYFAVGMLARSEDEVVVERYLAYICISMMFCFIAFAFVLYFQMKTIFSKILHMKLTVSDSEEDVARSESLFVH